MTVVRSQVDTFAVSSDEIIREVGKLYTAKPNEYALISSIMSRGMDFEKTTEGPSVSGRPMGVKIVYNPKFEQQVNEIESDEITVNLAAGYTAGDTSIVVSDGALVPKYALLYVPRTGEIMLVSSVSTHTLTVVRGQSGTTAAALVHGDTMIIQGSAYAEFALSGDARFKQTAFTYNYTQIDREKYGESRTSSGTKYYNNAQSYEMSRKNALVSMLRRFNGTLWLGGRSIDTTNKRRTMGGIFEFIDGGNVMDVNQNLTKADFDYFMANMAFSYNSNKKTLFCGKRLLNKIDGWYGEKRIETATSGKFVDFGFAVKTLRSRFGDLDLVWEPYYDKFTVGTNPINGWGAVLDLELINFVYLNNGILKAHDDIQANDRDGREGEWIMEAGIEVNVAKAHALIRNV